MAKVMTKAQVVSYLAEKAGIQKKAAAAVLEEIVALAARECKKGGQFVVPGLGKAVKAHRKARTGRNPQTGAPIKIPAKTVVKFRLARSFKDAVMPPTKRWLISMPVDPLLVIIGIGVDTHLAAVEPPKQSRPFSPAVSSRALELP